jgi:hypothetical protein
MGAMSLWRRVVSLVLAGIALAMLWLPAQTFIQDWGHESDYLFSNLIGGLVCCPGIPIAICLFLAWRIRHPKRSDSK